MSGMPNHHFLDECKFIGHASTLNRYGLHVCGGIPFLHNDEKKYNVVGEVYDVQQKELEKLDVLEANGTWYFREDLTVMLFNTNDSVKCQAYFCNDKADALDHGSFRAYMREDFDKELRLPLCQRMVRNSQFTLWKSKYKQSETSLNDTLTYYLLGQTCTYDTIEKVAKGANVDLELLRNYWINCEVAEVVVDNGHPHIICYV